MSVTNYIPDSCKYSIGKLMKSVYLISENAIKDIRIDNGEAWVNSISETPIRIDCTSVGLQEEESLDERYRFVHTLTFSVNGYANGDDFQGKYYAIVKDNNGTYWLVNPLFPCKVTYVYTLSNDENHTDFTLSTASNHPVLRLNGMVDARAYECKEYFIDGISELWLNEKRYSVHDGKDVKYTNDGFKVIDYNKNSATFTETFDGTNTSHSISFDVLFSSYKSSWHYNLLEFIDECIKNNNLYSAIIKTRNGKYAMCGFSYGLQPSFNINADDTTQEINKVQISLQDVHTVGDPIDFYNSADYTHLTAKTWVYTDEYDGYECVGDGLAKYLLQKEVDALGNDTCNYKALTGYENNFPELNIVGTFDDVVTFASSECTIMPCRLATSLQRNIVFNDVGSKTYTVRAGSDWTITSTEGITVSPSSGSANQSYTITVYNSHTPTADAWITNLKVSYCTNMTHNTVITVVEDEDSCFQGGSTIRISANEQTLTIPTQCCIKSVKERTGVGAIGTVYNDHITVYVPANNSGEERTAILLAELCDGSATNLNIIQGDLFERWVDDHTLCIGRSKYMLQYKYVGNSPEHCDTRTEETRTVLVEASSSDCIYEYRWVLSDSTECEDYNEYYLYKRQVRIIDSVDPWSDVVPAEYSIDGWGTMERVLFKKKSTNCGWVCYARYKWVDTNEGSCFEVKECEDYPQLNVPVCIRDGVVVSDDVSSVYDVSTSTTGRVYSNVDEILVNNELNFDATANEVVGFNTGLTINAETNISTKSNTGRSVVLDSRYQTLVGCDVENLTVNVNKMDGYGSTHYSPVYGFVYILKDTPLDGYSFIGSDGESITVYVQDWAVASHRKAYFSATGACDTNVTSTTVLPMTDNPVPMMLTEYSFSGTSYECLGGNKYEKGVVLSGGTVIGTGMTLYEEDSPDCQVEDYYLTFTALESGTFRFSGNTYEYGNSIWYSIDDGITWTYLTNNTNTPTIAAGKKIIWKGNGSIPGGSTGMGRFYSTCDFKVDGNIMSLVYNDNYSGQTSLSGLDYVFKDLFTGTRVVDASGLLLPATTLSTGCYLSLFSYCDKLTIAPELIATNLTERCYETMFQNCSSLTTAPVLRASILSYRSYAFMFENCFNLTYVKCLATDLYGESSTIYWTNNVSRTGTFVKATNMNDWEIGVNGIPDGWSIINE